MSVLVGRLLLAAALLGTVGSTLWHYPHQLAYFNELAGGPYNGWRHLLGSSLDWGQDNAAAEWIVAEIRARRGPSSGEVAMAFYRDSSFASSREGSKSSLGITLPDPPAACAVVRIADLVDPNQYRRGQVHQYLARWQAGEPSGLIRICPAPTYIVVTGLSEIELHHRISSAWTWRMPSPQAFDVLTMCYP